ncbi:DNA adenine methylase [Brevibacillus panacihumi W25]|uniref:Site-specific DNA-methyltransferase (adenine-specific) n=1 Tax=Brevibacillus panacihumi W25 TaxID=1408254 RepID=V6M852_9BACL|nr:Dam family site-specific DNA-(adenine-N6)-methyltransferase [Brevibacillus panacihumi]EST54035.1 DNA adenine methylase [Brevibacillus panacihumi W25]
MSSKIINLNTNRNLPVNKPILKWAGGKQQLWFEIEKYIPSNYNKYIEPFVGGGAIFFGLSPEKAVLSDTNPDLINLYEVVRDNVSNLIDILGNYHNDEEFYYFIRSQNPEKLSKLERAARTMFLNRTCYNGLYRVNKKGEFNVPFGKYKNPKICDEATLINASNALKGQILVCDDYLEVLNQYASEGDVIFLDPPYIPVSQYADFKRYTKHFFDNDDHRDLAEEVKRLYEMGCTVILTNSNHPLVHELYSDYKIEIHQTKRFINSKGNNRVGEDVIVLAQPNRKSIRVIKPKVPENQMEKFPGTRYMGSKQNLIGSIWDIAKQFKFESVLDAFSGSSVVGYMFKTKGKKVITNDFMSFSSNVAKSIIENNNVQLTVEDVDSLLIKGNGSGFIPKTFKGLYFSDDENIFIDDLRARIEMLDCPYKKAIAIAAICRACLKRRPRGIFTYVGNRYNDGRKDLQKSVHQHFLESVKLYNEAVFDNGQLNKSLNVDTMELSADCDLIYIDPPYYSPLSDNEYTRRYHFLEGVSTMWEGLEIQWETKTKKFKKYSTPFGNKDGAYDAFDQLFKKYQNSILMVSYSSNAFPTMDEMVHLMKKYKRNVDVHQIEHRYSFGNQAHKVNDNRNQVLEYIFVGY